MNSKIDIGSLKAKHRLELVMQEAGERFEIDPADPDQWHSLTTGGLSVDIRRQRYKIEMPGMDPKSGDVIAWLKHRYAWSFSMAISFLQSRAPDPGPAPHPARVETKSQIIRAEENETKPLDHWQERALQIGGERMRSYFSYSWYDLVMNTLTGI
jgi:hypothetical protein